MKTIQGPSSRNPQIDQALADNPGLSDAAIGKLVGKSRTAVWTYRRFVRQEVRIELRGAHNTTSSAKVAKIAEALGRGDLYEVIAANCRCSFTTINRVAKLFGLQRGRGKNLRDRMALVQAEAGFWSIS
jgi:hypothetical protein